MAYAYAAKAAAVADATVSDWNALRAGILQRDSNADVPDALTVVLPSASWKQEVRAAVNALLTDYVDEASGAAWTKAALLSHLGIGTGGTWTTPLTFSELSAAVKELRWRSGGTATFVPYYKFTTSAEGSVELAAAWADVLAKAAVAGGDYRVYKVLMGNIMPPNYYGSLARCGLSWTVAAADAAAAGAAKLFLNATAIEVGNDVGLSVYASSGDGWDVGALRGTYTTGSGLAAVTLAVADVTSPTAYLKVALTDEATVPTPPADVYGSGLTTDPILIWRRDDYSYVA